MKFLTDLAVTASLLLFALVFLIFAATLSGCGPYKVDVAPIEATVKHQIDLTPLLETLRQQCIVENPYFTEEQIVACSYEKLNNILEAMGLTR